MSDLLVNAAWLASHRDEVVVADTRWSATGGTAEAERAFEAGHIPGAAFFDVDRDLAGVPFVDGPGRHPLPKPGRFAARLAASGIAPGDRVVAYDDGIGSVAARLWWMLDGIGTRCALLDGGLAAWEGPLETGPAAARSAAEADVRPWPEDRLVDADGVAEALRAGEVVIDARVGERYRGETEPIDPVAGHIPGARSAPFPDVVGTDGRFRSSDELRERFRGVGVSDTMVPIAYCGSGVTASLDVFALKLAGLGEARLYEGSWSDWVYDPVRPVATGAEP
jgi:thiosulfate/3-mercaptopyruvate sulfurtransferase